MYSGEYEDNKVRCFNRNDIPFVSPQTDKSFNPVLHVDSNISLIFQNILHS